MWLLAWCQQWHQWFIFDCYYLQQMLHVHSIIVFNWISHGRRRCLSSLEFYFSFLLIILVLMMDQYDASLASGFLYWVRSEKESSSATEIAQ